MKTAVAAVTLALALSSFPAIAASANAVTSPEQAFGFKPGTDRKLAYWKQLTA
jgi:hypothetical protein